ncbi:retrovirus-related pol polyprotein from transposon TNT 1-94 [Tanacetum coccineum]
MLTKPKFFYDRSTKKAIGYQNPYYLKKAQQLEPKLYDGNVMQNTYSIDILNSEETLILPEESPFWTQNFVNSTDPSPSSTPSKVEVPKELPKMDIDEIETLNIKLDHRVSKLVAENEHLKQTYKKLYDSIKPTRIRFDYKALKNDLRKLKGKALVNDAVTKDTSDPEMLKIDMETITPKLLNKRTAHSAYIKHTQEKAAVPRDLVEHIKANYPLDPMLESAFRYTKLIQELLTNISKTCPSINNFGVRPSTSANRSLPSGDTKKDMRNAYPLTKITTTTKVPPRKPTILETDAPKPAVNLVYLRKPRKSLHGPVSKPKITKSLTANNKEPSKSRGSTISNVPYSSLDECRLGMLQSQGCTSWTDLDTTYSQSGNFVIRTLKLLSVNTPALYVGISHETSVARTPQQNGVVERRNRTLIEATHTILIYAQALLFLWAEAVAITCYTINCFMIRLRHGKTPYELLHNKLPDLSFLHVFGALCYPMNDSENLGKL